MHYGYKNVRWVFYVHHIATINVLWPVNRPIYVGPFCHCNNILLFNTPSHRFSPAHPHASNVACLVTDVCVSFAGGTLKIYGESLCRDVPYKTLLLSIRDCAQAVVREMLAKYGLDKTDPLHYCLVQVSTTAKAVALSVRRVPTFN